MEKKQITNKIEKVDLTSLSKRELALLVQSLSQGTYVVDGLWFLAVEETMGLKKAIELDKQVWSVAAGSEGRRIKDLLNIPEGLIGLAKAFNFHVMFLDTEYEVTQPSEGTVVFTVTKCKPQLARIKKGLGEFPCKEVGIPCMTSFGKGIDSRAKVRCVTCPPDPHPENIWCAWEFSLS